MAFLIYKKYANAETVRYEKVRPLKLGGRDGLIAQHVNKLPAAGTRSWKLGAATLLKLAGFAGAVDELAVLFDVAGKDAPNVCLYELTRIHGSCLDTSTQLALDFAVVVDQEIDGDAAAYVNSFEIPVPEKPRLLGETLALTGGPGGGDWKWAATSLQIGATVVQAQPGHGHGTGEPCPSCTCGRREAMKK
ncbi:MAG: hypothetical protein P4N60_07010 [Verrucomicrobiae bacterium]|nr:hypothetical protein [Verrucomicrobiae bacterium]